MRRAQRDAAQSRGALREQREPPAHGSLPPQAAAQIRRAAGAAALLGAALMGAALIAETAQAETFAAQNERLFQQMEEVHGLTEPQLRSLREIFARSGYIGQGNPAISQHAATPQQCEAKLAQAGVNHANPEFERICGAKYMAPLYDPATQKPADAQACIDQFEFPNIPCAWPVTWVKTSEAAEICYAQGKRLCEAHEWEGACDGAVGPAEYRWDLLAGVSPEEGIRRMRAAHNRIWEPKKRWAYGPEPRPGVCAQASHKSDTCPGGGWSNCGSNTYPTGMFPQCVSSLGVYDQHGNVAEHMNLPLNPEQMASHPSHQLGYTEMKGSWFIFDSYRAHPDWCRWRAPYWHGTKVMSSHSHANYHLGFRCCADVAPPAPPRILPGAPAR